MARHLLTCPECGMSKYVGNREQIYCSRECVSSAIRNARSGSDYRTWKRLVLERAEYECESCGIHTSERKVIAHHIVPLSECQEAKTELSNGQALCILCHDVVHDQVGNTSFRQVFGRYSSRGVST